MPLNEEKRTSLKRLHRVAFGDSERYVDFFFRRRFREELYAARFSGDCALSVAYARLVRLSLGTTEFDVPFLTGVATLPEARRRGLAREVILELHEKLAALGYPFALLHPFNHDFYRKLGYVTLSRVRPAPLVLDPLAFARPAKKSDLDTLFRLSRKALEPYPFRRSRTPTDWEEIWEEWVMDGGSVSIIEKSGSAIGYFLYADGILREAFSEGGIYPEDFAFKPLMFDREGEEYTMGIVLDEEKTRKLQIDYMNDCAAREKRQGIGLPYPLAMPDTY